MEIKNNLLEKVSCNICGSNIQKNIFSLNGWNIVKCQRCGFCFVNPRFKSCVLEEGYDDKNEFSPIIHSSINPSNPTSDKLRRGYFVSLLEIIRRYKKAGKLLDIGCGDGGFLRLAQDNGWEPHGVEIGNWARSFTKKRNINISIGKLKDIGFPAAYFDIIFSNEVFEHLSDPSDMLIEIKRILKDDGIVVIAGVPNFNSLSIRLGVDRFISNTPPGHINYFVPKTLERLARKTGFRALKISTIGMANIKNLLSLHKKEKDFIKEKTLETNLAGKRERRFIRSRFRNLIKIPANLFLDSLGIGDSICLVCCKDRKENKI